MKFKTLIHSLILRHFCRVSRALSKAKSISVQTLKEMHLMTHFIEPLLLKKGKKKKKTKLFLGSFRLHYNWCTNSSHVLPIPSPTLDHHNRHLYYDATWHSYVTMECSDDDEDSPELSGYLHWLERKGYQKSANHDQHNHQDDINRLADAFIESCHEKFRLEKQDSYRRFQEMMERSV
ncbi:uncharacterized protein LOC124939530 [Impatiens glandulifera]|uniref:uncharacterized protein LOC124939530 n=1 Tax=Impatiens glandulifera TaxID=253017 RepID=UPI001FB1125E|nr:uncharacterized protein LOC124939530 [Impatiens glandulifera]